MMSNQEKTTGTSGQTDEMASREQIILHVSDIHIGMHFDVDKWNALKYLAEKVGPDVVAVTGDVVNSPWRWVLRRARDRLEELRLAAAKGGREVTLVCVPGNHDTRLQGVLTLSSITVIGLIALATALLIPFISGNFESFVRGVLAGQFSIGESVFVLSGFVALLAVSLRSCLVRDLESALSPFYIKSPVLLAGGRIGILPFDSASKGLSFARGYVLRGQMTAARQWVEQQLTEDRETPFFIALVHHHPLPLPYDHANEEMMVMDNAGEFLQQMARSKVRLVLHGHKHHQHYARLAVDPASPLSERVEVAVLSAGSPTAGRGAQVRGHGFNVIALRADHQLAITRYESHGAPTFDPQPVFTMVPDEEHRRLRYEAQRQRSVATCKRVVCVADINQYGDSRFTREYRGLHTKLATLNHLPTPLRCQSENGVVQPYRAKPLSLNGPGVHVKCERISINRVQGTICFKSAGLSEGYSPIDFQLSIRDNNAIALNEWQFSQMYPERPDHTEYVQFGLNNDVAAEELVIHVHFCEKLRLPSRVDALWRRWKANDWAKLDADILRIDTQNSLQITLRHPEQEAVYRLAWDVDDGPDGRAQQQGASEALLLRHLLPLVDRDRQPAELQQLLHDVLDKFKLIMEPEPSIPLRATLFAYDQAKHRLFPISSTNHSLQGDYRFGLGIAGRAFKSVETLSFILPAQAQDICATGYLKPDGTLPESLGDIPEQGIVCIPLHPQDGPNWPFAVLQVDWSVHSRALRKAVEQGKATDLQRAYAGTMSGELRRILASADGFPPAKPSPSRPGSPDGVRAGTEEGTDARSPGEKYAHTVHAGEDEVHDERP